MALSGDYAELKSLIYDLQQIRDMVVVEQLSMTNSDPFTKNITMELRLTVYLREGMNRQKLILFVLLILLAGVIIRSYFTWPHQKSVATLKYPPGAQLQADKLRPAAAVAPTVPAAQTDSRSFTWIYSIVNSLHLPAINVIFLNLFSAMRKAVAKKVPHLSQCHGLTKPLQPPLQPAGTASSRTGYGDATAGTCQIYFLRFYVKRRSKDHFSCQGEGK